MSILQAIILGIVQGLTEFLPVSSSGHLVLVPWWLGWPSPGLAFDTMLHLGTLLAVLAYFWRLWWDMFVATWHRLRRRPTDGSERLLLFIIIGTIPAAIVGYLFEDFFSSLFESPFWVSFFLIITGLLLVLAERLRRGDRQLDRINTGDAIVVGLAQAAAIAPGLSRSGSTIAAGLLRGLDRTAAARYSFLLSTPIILGAGLFQLKDLVSLGTTGQTSAAAIVAGFAAAAITGFLTIRWLLRYLQNHSLYVFAIYVWIVAGLTLLRLALA